MCGKVLVANEKDELLDFAACSTCLRALAFFRAANWYVSAETSQMKNVSRSVIRHGIHS